MLFPALVSANVIDGTSQTPQGVGLGWESKSLYESTRWGKGIGELFVVLRHGIGRDLMRGIRRGLFHSVVQEEVSDQHPMFPYDRSKH
jgi:hypothetical protein